MNPATHLCRPGEKLSVKQLNDVFLLEVAFPFHFIRLFCLSSSFALLFVSAFFGATCDR